MEYLKIAEDFGKKIWPYINKIKIADIMLYGSVAYGKKNPTDLDLLVLHYNELLDNFQEIAESKKIGDSKKLIDLSNKLNGEINLMEVLQESNIKKLISQNKFNTKFMNISFFTNSEYRTKWKERDLKTHEHAKSSHKKEGETFEECIFMQGLLYNQETQKYDVPALQKYNPKN